MQRCAILICPNGPRNDGHAIWVLALRGTAHGLVMELLFGGAAFVFFKRRRFVLNDPDGISINLGCTVRTLLPFSGIKKLTDLVERAMAVLSARVYLFTLAWTSSVLWCQHLLTWSCLGLSARCFFYWEVTPAPVAQPL